MQVLRQKCKKGLPVLAGNVASSLQAQQRYFSYREMLLAKRIDKPKPTLLGIYQGFW